MHAVAGQVLLEGDALYLFIRDNATAIIGEIPDSYRQSNGYRNVVAIFANGFYLLPRFCREPVAEKGSSQP